MKVKYPKLIWNELNNKNDQELRHFIDDNLKWLYSASNTYLFYFRQRYDHENEWDYLTVLIEVSPTNDDIIVDWDYDEGQEHREWIAYADLLDLIMPDTR